MASKSDTFLTRSCAFVIFLYYESVANRLYKLNACMQGVQTFGNQYIIFEITIPLTCLHTQIRILCEQYSYLRNDVPGKKPGYSQAQGIGWGAWDAQARQTWIWENGVKRGTGNCLNEVSFARPSLAFSHFSKFLVCPCTNPQRPTQSPEPYLYKYLILPNLDILPKSLYNLKSDNVSQ